MNTASSRDLLNQLKRAKGKWGIGPRTTLVTVVMLLAVAPWFVSGYTANDILAKAMIMAMLAIALDFSWGYGGILSLGHSAFFGAGAYAMAIVLESGMGSYYPAAGMALAIVIPAVLAAAVSIFIFYGLTSTLLVAIATLSLPVILSAVDLRIPQWTGGQTGLSGFPLFPWSQTIVYYVILLALVGCTALLYRITTSDFGRLLTAVRDNEQRAKFLGYNTPLIRTINFTLSAAIAGFAGAMYAPYNGFVSHDLLGFVLSTNAVVWVAIGGRGTLVGPLLGALLINFLEPTLNAAIPGYWQLVLGFVFVVVILLFPAGVYGLFSSILSSATESIKFATKAPEKQSAEHTKLALGITGLKVSFSGLEVIRKVDLDVNSGSLHCLIGPNGAGKSTLINAVTGMTAPAAGKISLRGTDITGLAADKIARLRILRTFQASNVFESISVDDNIFLASCRGGIPSFIQRRKVVELPEQARRVLDLSGLESKSSNLGRNLGHGERKWLELVMVLAADPLIVFLDEPTAGLSASDRTEVGEVLVTLVREYGLGLLLIEHDLDFVKAIADRVTVLSDGGIVEDGTVDQVAGSKTVREVYLGSSNSVGMKALS